MLFKIAALSLMSLCLVTGSKLPGQLPRSTEHSLMEFMMRSSDLPEQYSQRSMPCFETYIPQMNANTAKLEKSVQACGNVAIQTMVDIDDSFQPQRKELESLETSSFQLMEPCKKYRDSLSLFECYMKAGLENWKTMYAISANSAEYMADVHEQFRLVDIEKYVCTNKSDRAYVRDTANTYEELSNCMHGQSPVPTPNTSSEAPVETTTEAQAKPTSEEPDEFNERPDADFFAARTDNIQQLLSNFRKHFSNH